jgi:ribose transport system permease protein
MPTLNRGGADTRLAAIRGLLRAHGFLFALIAAALLLAANIIALPAFVAYGNWATNVATFAPFAILAVASTPAIMTGGGGLDLSIAPSANLANIVLVTGLLAHSQLSSPWVAVPLTLLASALIGLFNGTVISILRLPPVVMTVGMLLLLTGFNDAITPLPVSVTTPWVQSLNGSLGPVPWGVILILVPIGFWVLLRRTPFYSTLLFVGGDAATAYSAGVNVNAVRIVAYTIGGLFAGVGGLALTAVFQTADPSIGFQYALIAVAAVAMGGTPIAGGGRGGILGSVLGAAVIYLLDNFLVVVHVSDQWAQVGYGSLLLIGATAGAVMAAPPRTPRATRAAAVTSS